MTTCYQLKKNINLKDFANVVHPADRTGRPQVVTISNNPEYYNLLKKVKTLSGVGAILNTSFNIHKKTIVETIDDAISVFNSTNLDGLINRQLFYLKIVFKIFCLIISEKYSIPLGLNIPYLG